MAIDPSIPLRAVQQQRRPNLLGQAAQIMQMQQFQKQNELADRQMQRENALRQAVAGAVGPDGQPDWDRIAGVQLQSGDVSGALSTRKSVADARTAELNVSLKRLEQLEKVADRTAAVLMNTTPQTWQQDRQQAIHAARIAGVPDEQIAALVPEQFDPGAVQRLAQSTMTVKEQLENQRDQIRLALERKRVDLEGRPTYSIQQTADGIVGVDTRNPGNIMPTGLQSKPTSPLVQMSPGETEQQKEVGKFFGQQFSELQQGAQSSRRELQQLRRLDQLLDQVETGAGAGLVTDAKRVAKTLGVDLEAIGVTDDTAPAEASRAIANEFALQLRNPAGGAGMPGAMSDKDREFLQSMVPGLAQSREGRKLLIEARAKVAQRNIEVARMAREYYQEHGGLDVGFYDQLDEFSRRNELFTNEDLTQMERARLPHPKTPDEARQLPPGTRFVTPSGQIKMVPGG